MRGERGETHSPRHHVLTPHSPRIRPAEKMRFLRFVADAVTLLSSMDQHPLKKPATPASWAPGRSGNPKGRPPKGSALTDAIRDKVDPVELIDIALELARSGEAESTRLGALAWLRDSGYTRPAEKHEHAMSTPEQDDDGLESLTDAELDELARVTSERDAILGRGRQRALPDGGLANHYSGGHSSSETVVDAVLIPPVVPPFLSRKP